MHIKLEQKLNTKLVGQEWMQKKKKKWKIQWIVHVVNVHLAAFCLASLAICTSICTSFAVQVCLLAGKSGLLLAYGHIQKHIYMYIHI